MNLLSVIAIYNISTIISMYTHDIRMAMLQNTQTIFCLSIMPFYIVLSLYNYNYSSIHHRNSVPKYEKLKSRLKIYFEVYLLL